MFHVSWLFFPTVMPYPGQRLLQAYSRPFVLKCKWLDHSFFHHLRVFRIMGSQEAMALILVTGATGHIGNVLVHALSRRFPEEIIRVFLQPRESLEPFDRLTLQLYYGDIRKKDDVRAAIQGTRLVFHLAGIIDTSLHPGPRIYEINVGGTRNVVEACKAEPSVRLIYVSSVHALPD
ncbi:MAG: NAD-dependent epimerase/dehydratase family protein, partial [Clostridia bacterium]|nr:NAD-dependent epimerase/dehydratase family protein [Clostridia bacterium]